MAGPFKMKGSPMQRNFGIGGSPLQKGTKYSAKITGTKWKNMTPEERDAWVVAAKEKAKKSKIGEWTDTEGVKDKN
tara:strand:- start:53 stop:280 length:228 start_codon:yes stop_codon:yes gene_type:complete